MPKENEKIAERLFELAELLEMKDANSFRIQAYRSAATTIQRYPRKISDMVEAEVDLTRLHGVGNDIANKIKEIVSSGELEQLENLKQGTNPEVVQLLSIPGLGAKRVQQLQEELDIGSVAELRQAAIQNKVQKIDGFGEKLEQKILDSTQKWTV